MSQIPARIEAPSKLPKLWIDNDQLLKQIMSQEIVHIAVNSVDILDVKKSCVNECNKSLELETDLFKKKDFIEKEAYDKHVKSYSTLEKNCISLELATQLNQEIFQRENSDENLNAPTFNQLFEINEFKAQSQENDTVIRKLKDRLKSFSRKDSVENVKKDIDEIETINIELEHNQFDSIRKICVQSKEHCDSLIAQINAKYVENSDLNAQLQEKVFAIAALKNKLKKLKGKNVVDTAVSKPSATIAPGMFKLGIEPISHRLKNNRDVHAVYLDKTIEYTDTLCGFVERAKQQNPSEPLLESTYMFTKHVQELLVYVSKTSPDLPNPSEKLVAVTPLNKNKRVRFAEPITSSSNIPNQTNFLKTKDSNKPLLTSTGVKPTTSATESKPLGNTKNNRITRPPSRTFTIVRNRCPLTRITSNKIVPLKETIIAPVVTRTSRILVYSRRPKATRFVGSSSKVVQIVLWYLDSDCSKHMTRNRSQLINFDSKFLGTVRFGNDHIAKIMGFRDYQIVLSAIPLMTVKTLELAAMASEQFSSGPGPKLLTLGTISSGLYLNPSPCVDHQVPIIIALDLAISTGKPSSTTIDQDAPSLSTSQTTQETPPQVIPLDVEEVDHDIEVAHMDNNPNVDFPIPEPSFEESST
ncbi:hypothetical protein Tco_0335736 [Tanacetum coccineum]